MTKIYHWGTGHFYYLITSYSFWGKYLKIVNRKFAFRVNSTFTYYLIFYLSKILNSLLNYFKFDNLISCLRFL
jgi:hypothetical protein